ncbi:MAG TPA: H-X9-DG-CTERM domain-containing protein [Tepidisphaeraceae bacterium]|jgi:prepilin-type processing-associated H-X9-DG protein
MKFIAAFLSLALVAPAVSFGQALADRLPGDAEVYAGWSGTDSIGPGYDQSHLKAVLDASQIGQFFHDSIPRLIATVAAKDPESAKQIQQVLDLVAPMAVHPSAFYFGGMLQGAPLPKIAMICDAGADAGKIITQVNQLLQQASGNPFTCRAVGTLVVLSDFAFPEQVENPLSANAAFQAAMGNLGKDRAAAIYVNATAVMNTINDAIQVYAPPPARQNWLQVRNALGIAGLKTIAATAGLDGKDWTMNADVLAPAPRHGLLAMCDGDPLSADLLKTIPVSAVIAGAFPCDFDKAFKSIQHLFEQFAPEQASQFQQGVGQANQMLGFDLEKDLLAALGPQWAYYIDPEATGDGLLGTTIVNRPRDADQLGKSLSALETLANGLIQQGLQNSDSKITVEFRKETIEGTDVHFLAIPFVSPSWAIKSGTLYVGLFPQVVVSAMDRPADAKSIQDNPDYQAVLQKLNGPAALCSVGYMDLPKTLSNSYQTSLALSRLYFGVCDLFGAETGPMIMPPLGKIQAEMEPAGSIGWSDDAGYHLRAIEPFPGACALGSSQAVASLGVGQSALMASIMIPSLNRARETANRVKCASNLRQIGQAILLYSNDKKGQYPPDLGTLIKTEDITISVFVCPDSHGPPPPAGMTPDQQADWVNQNSDYIYVGAGMKQGVDGMTVVCYEKDVDHGNDGMNILFGDGHVEFLTLKSAHELIEKSGAPQGNNGGGGGGGGGNGL